MIKEQMSLEEFRSIGLEALARELGPVGMVRFLQQFEKGRGDYTSEREKLIGKLELPSIVKEIERTRRKK